MGSHAAWQKDVLLRGAVAERGDWIAIGIDGGVAVRRAAQLKIAPTLDEVAIVLVMPMNFVIEERRLSHATLHFHFDHASMIVATYVVITKKVCLFRLMPGDK